PTITAGERMLLLDVARSFNQQRKPNEEPRSSGPTTHAGERPGDLFNQRESWLNILTPHGWSVIGNRGEETLWSRPGKSPAGPSATTNYKGSDLFYAFSTNATPFQPQESYSKFAAYALLEHNGDYKAAARAIADRYEMSRGEAGTSGGARVFWRVA